MLIYTVIVNAYDRLLPLPAGLKGVCISDGTVEPSEGWEIREIKKVYPNPRHTALCPRILVYKYFPEADLTLYVDGNIEILQDPNQLVEELEMKHDAALFPHPQRSCVYVEASEMIKRKKQGPIVTEKQVAYYRAHNLPEDSGLATTWVIIRRNTPQIQWFNEWWWEDFMRFPDSTHNDQLSFGYLMWKLGFEYDKIPGDLFKGTSKYFRRHKHLKVLPAKEGT